LAPTNLAFQNKKQLLTKDKILFSSVELLLLLCFSKEITFPARAYKPENGTYIFLKGPGIRFALLFSFPIWSSSEQLFHKVAPLQL